MEKPQAPNKPALAPRSLIMNILWTISALVLLWYSLPDSQRNLITGLWRPSSCGTFTGSTPDGSVTYSFRTKGETCDTTYAQTQIPLAIEHRLKVEGGGICATQCLNLKKPFDGYLLLGPSDNFDSSIYCGPVLSLSSHCDG